MGMGNKIAFNEKKNYNVFLETRNKHTLKEELNELSQ
jgi:hypothetical protein